MARFYSELKSVRGKTVTRLGHANVEAKVAGWGGGVRVTAYRSDAEDRVRIEFVTHKGAGEYREIYDGPLDHFERAYLTVDKVTA